VPDNGGVIALDNLSQMVQQAKMGDREAYGYLYEEIYTQLYKVAYFTLGVKEDAEDVVSETFIEGYKGIQNLKEPTAFKSWMHKILNARCKRRIKRYIDQRNNVVSDDVSDLIVPGADSTGSDIERMDLLHALKTLSLEEREIVVLAVVEGYKIREIGEIIGSPMGTVSSKLHRSLRKLRTLMEGSEVC